MYSILNTSSFRECVEAIEVTASVPVLGWSCREEDAIRFTTRPSLDETVDGSYSLFDAPSFGDFSHAVGVRNGTRVSVSGLRWS